MDDGDGLAAVPAFSFSRFNVLPPWTRRSDRTMVEHNFFDMIAIEYPSDPLNVQDELSLLATAFSRLGAGVGAGAGAGAGLANKPRAPRKTTTTADELYMILQQVKRV
jgi:hypothetical protein